MRKENRAAARFPVQTAQNVLPEGVVGSPLRRRAVKISAPWIGGEGIAIPLLDGVWRIGEDEVERH